MHRNMMEAMRRSPATPAPTAIPIVLPLLDEPFADLAATRGVEVGSEAAVAAGVSEEVVGTGVFVALLGGGPAVSVALRTLYSKIC
jgi:hypothetical protein